LPADQDNFSKRLFASANNAEAAQGPAEFLRIPLHFLRAGCRVSELASIPSDLQQREPYRGASVATHCISG
jgi:hypothetical protein